MKLAFSIALRFLSSNKGQTLLIALGIAVGISVQIFIGSLIQGLQASLLDATIGKSAHITVNAMEKNQPLKQYSEIESWLKNTYPEIESLSPTLSKGAFLKVGDTTEQILFRGFEFEKANAIYQFEESLTEGNFPKMDNEILLGLDLAKDNGISLGDSLELITPEGKTYTLIAVGFLDLKVAALNKTWVLGSLKEAKTLFAYDNQDVTSIEMQIAEPFAADLLAEKMKADGSQFSVKFDDWKSQNQQLLSGLSGQSSSSLIIQVFVVISVVLGIASVLAISVLQKSKQIGIPKAMGITDGNASLVFLFQGFILGILGGIMGIALGLGLLWSFSKFALNADGAPVVPIFINYSFIALSGAIAIIASTLAAIIPAVKSRTLSPIEVIKNG